MLPRTPNLVQIFPRRGSILCKLRANPDRVKGVPKTDLRSSERLQLSPCHGDDNLFQGGSLFGHLKPHGAATLRAHLDTAPGPRTVPVRSMSARRGGLQKVSDFVPGHALRTGTVRGPAGAVPRCALRLPEDVWMIDVTTACN